MNKKSYSFDMETFTYMLMICRKPPGLKFEDPTFEEEILTFIRELGYSCNIKLLSDVKIDTLPQPWGTFGTIIYKCLIDQSIQRRNKVDWHMANDDLILTTMRFIPQYEVVQRYGAILPDYLTNPTMKESKAYKTYHDLATRKVQPKQKYVCRSSRTKTDEAPKPSLGVLDAPTYRSDDEEIPWKSSDEDDDDEVNVSEHKDEDDDERTKSDNDGDDFVHPKFLTHDDEAKKDEKVYEEDSFDLRTYVEDEVNVLYGDVNINLEGRGTVMTDAPLRNIQATQETKDTHVILTALINPEGQQQSSSVLFGFFSNMLNPRLDTSIDLIFNLNTKATSLVDVPVTIIVEPPLVFATTLPQPPTHFITHIQQTLASTPKTIPSPSLQDLPNFGSLFGIVDAYLANKMNEAVKTAIQLHSDRLKDEAQAKNEDFLTKLDDNIKKIIKDQVK
ncbi:hypothetical protein Tco_1358421 [Tanacetum coccineum]